MKKVLGWLGDRVQVSTNEGTSNVLDTFVDDDGSVVAIADTDPRHPSHPDNRDTVEPGTLGTPGGKA